MSENEFRTTSFKFLKKGFTKQTKNLLKLLEHNVNNPHLSNTTRNPNIFKNMEEKLSKESEKNETIHRIVQIETMKFHKKTLHTIYRDNIHFEVLFPFKKIALNKVKDLSNKYFKIVFTNVSDLDKELFDLLSLKPGSKITYFKTAQHHK